MRKHILKKKKTLKSLSIFRACRRINDTHETKTGFYKKEQSESKKEFSEMVYCVIYMQYTQYIILCLYKLYIKFPKVKTV